MHCSSSAIDSCRITLDIEMEILEIVIVMGEEVRATLASLPLTTTRMSTSNSTDVKATLYTFDGKQNKQSSTFPTKDESKQREEAISILILPGQSSNHFPIFFSSSPLQVPSGAQSQESGKLEIDFSFPLIKEEP